VCERWADDQRVELRILALPHHQEAHRAVAGPRQRLPHAPDRQLQTIESPLARLHVFCNRLAHHQRVWSHALDERYEDILALAGYIDPALPGWIAATSRVPQTLSAKP
jgi:hypothetical protein